MMKTAIFFSNEEELQKLTGLSHQALWDNGFDLDDWDWGFVSDTYWSPHYGSPLYEYWILNHMHNYCTGYKCVNYNNKFFYMLYHS